MEKLVLEDKHYFLSKSDILGWVNDTLGLRLTKIEECATGAVAVQILDALHPGTVQLKRVDFNARNEYDMINNYKVLQDAFNKLNVQKTIEVAKLIKAKPLDNMEFMQWLKSYFDSVTSGQPVTDYDGPARRAASKTGDIKGASGPNSKLAPSSFNGRAQAAAASSAAAVPRKPAGATAVPSASHSSPAASKAHHAPAGGSGGGGELSAQLAEAKATVDMLEKEKQFYYSKLRDIELLCQTPKINETPILKRVEAILYAPTAEEGRQLLIETQQEFAGQVFLEEDEAAAQASAEAAANLLEGSYKQ